MKLQYAALTATGLILAANTALAANAPTNKTDKISYAIGVDVGKGIKQLDTQINMDMFIQGLKDGKQENKTLMTDEQMRDTLMALQTEMMEKQKQKTEDQAKENLKASEKFLSENKSKDGVKTLPSGLQYRIIEEGKGQSPNAEDTVVTHYRGKLIDGTEFDSSYSRGEPAKFKVNGVIPGWTEALQMMKPGAKWELFVPPKLGYGEHGIGQVISPNSTLIFDIELLSVEKEASKSADQKGEKEAAKKGS